MTASRTYSPGDVILNCEPMAHVIDESQKGERCDHCLHGDRKLLACAKCRNMYYCGRDCQRRDWRYHKSECRIYAHHYANTLADDYMARLLMRLWLLIDSNAGAVNEGFELNDGRSRRVFEMESHERELRADRQRVKQFEVLRQKLDACGVRYSAHDVFLIFGFIIINAFSIYDMGVTDDNRLCIVETGHALYVSGGYYNHSCAPNACSVYTSYHLQLRAIKPIAVGDEIFIHYIVLDLPKAERMAKLREHYYFECQCLRCSSADNVVDYEKYDKLKSEFQRIILAENEDNRQSSCDYSSVFDETLAIGRQIYGAYHPDLVTLMMAIMLYKLNNPRATMSTKCDDRAYVERLADSVAVVFGDTHKINHIFKEKSTNLLAIGL